MRKFPRRALLRYTAAAAVAVSMILRGRRSFAATRIAVTDFGAVTDGVTDVSKAVAAAIAACPKSGAVLVFPKGKYRFTQNSGNAIALTGFSNIEIDGEGSLLLLSGTTCAFSINLADGVHLHDFVLDWDPAPFSQGKVVALSADGKTVDVTLDGGGAVNTSVFSVRVFDPQTRLPQVIRSDADKLPALKSLTATGGRGARLIFDQQAPLPVGTLVVLLHTRASFGVIFGDAKNVEVRKVDLHTAPGFAFSGTGVTNLDMTDCRVAPPEGSASLVSSTADGFHFWGSRGNFRIANTIFSGICDDCMNVHGFLLRARRTSLSTLLFSNMIHTNGSDHAVANAAFPASGDQVTLLDPSSFQPTQTATIAAVARDGGQVTATIRSPAEKGDENILVENESQLPHLEVIDCKFHGSSNGGVVAHANASIEGNEFSELGWAGVICSVDQTWLEGPLVSNVAIQRNSFRRCGTHFRLSILVHALMQGGREAMGPPMNHNVTIAENKFEDPLGTVIFVAETDGLTIERNEIQSDRTPNDPLAPSSAIYLMDVKNATVGGNSTDHPRQIVAAKSDKATLVTDNNQGFTLRYE